MTDLLSPAGPLRLPDLGLSGELSRDVWRSELMSDAAKAQLGRAR